MGVEGVYRHQPQDDYWPGPDSLSENRVSYLYEDNEFNGRAVFTPDPGSQVGTRFGRIAPGIDSGTDKVMPSIEQVFDDDDAPGLTEQPTGLYGEGFAEIDYRDEPGHTRAGGHYTFRLRSIPTVTSINTASRARRAAAPVLPDLRQEAGLRVPARCPAPTWSAAAACRSTISRRSAAASRSAASATTASATRTC